MRTLKRLLRYPYHQALKLKEKLNDQRILKFTTGTNTIGVTYLNERFTDGAGAQLQRIYGIYAISRLLGVNYIHSPLFRLDYQGLAALENKTFDDQLINRYNQLFSIPSDIILPHDFAIREYEHFSLSCYEQLRREAASQKKFILAKIMLPYGITDRYPSSYHAVKELSPFARDSTPVIRIAMHVRRGDLAAVAANRILPNSYYISVAMRIRDALESLHLDYVFELHTETPTKAFQINLDEQDTTKSRAESFVLDPSADRLEEFDVIPNLEMCLNEDPIETLERMATADILVMSRSSYSYLAAILNQSGIVIYHDFWHSMLEDWIRADPNGEFSIKRLSSSLKEKINSSPSLR